MERCVPHLENPPSPLHRESFSQLFLPDRAWDVRGGEGGGKGEQIVPASGRQNRLEFLDERVRVGGFEEVEESGVDDRAENAAEGRWAERVTDQEFEAGGKIRR